MSEKVKYIVAPGGDAKKGEGVSSVSEEHFAEYIERHKWREATAEEAAAHEARQQAWRDKQSGAVNHAANRTTADATSEAPMAKAKGDK